MNRCFAVITLLCCVLLRLCHGGEFSDMAKLTPGDFKRLRADSWSVVGKNIIISGNVYLPVNNLELYADKIVVNLQSRDFEAVGNVRAYRWEKMNSVVSLQQLNQLQNSQDIIIEVQAVSRDIWDQRSIKISGSYLADSISASRLAGNLNSGYFRFDNVLLRYNSFVCKAKSGERSPAGVITLKNAEISACDYLISDNAHYSISAGEATLTPHQAEFYGAEHINYTRGDYSVFMRNGFAKIHGIPVLWLPVFYKPKDESPGLFSVQWGKNGDWGYYLNLSKKFVLYDYPYASVKVLADWYEKRGFGYGISGRVQSENSTTELFAYSIYDTDVKESNAVRHSRWHTAPGRFDMRLTNLTHVTSRLDFRGVMEWTSDYYFRYDFFEDRYRRDTRPASFVALEQQFDHLSASIYLRPQINTFYTTVEKLPEIRIDIPRQEIFETGLYYQGNLVMDNFRMRWADFERQPYGTGPYDKLRDYDAFRVDTTHFLYYPIRHDYFTLVPRAGFKFTGYSDSSRQRISDKNLLTMFAEADPENHQRHRFNNYDSKGNSRVRFLGEVGFELSTKIHNTWKDVRNYWLGVDGLRHVMRPYLNYTYIFDPGEKREKLYFFDDIDRIEDEHFVRLGVENRLQTRVGNAISDRLIMKNFWDYHFNRNGDLGRSGDFGTELTFTLFKGLSLNSTILVDTGNNNGKPPRAYRHGRDAGYPGTNIDWLNMLNFGLSYAPSKDYYLNFYYIYQRPYVARSAYSMGSTLTQLNASSYFDHYQNDVSEELSLAGGMPLDPDHRTLGFFDISYDLRAGRWKELNFGLLRKFHCWSLIGTLGFEREDERGKPNWDISYSLQVNLTGLNDPLSRTPNTVLDEVNRRDKESPGITLN